MYPRTPFVKHPSINQFLLNGHGPLTEELLPWLCRTPTITTYRVNLLKTTIESFKARVEKLLMENYKNPPEVYTMPDIPEVLCIGPITESLADTNKDTTDTKEIIVDSCCAAALLRGAHIYAPGVLAMETGTQLGANVLVYADLAGKCKKGTSKLYKSPQKMFIGIGVARLQRHQLFAAQAVTSGIAIEMKNTISNVPILGDLSGPEALLQNLPSIVCVRVLDPQPGEVVLDMCAAPGNKTTHIAEMMGNQGIIVALDKTESKIRYVKEQIERNQLNCVNAFAFDATLACNVNGTRIKSECDIKPPFVECSFDRILLDAPCSALGNRPVLNNTMTPEMLQSFPIVQRKLFASAVALLRPSGVLVYSTCTITLEENEGMVAWALKKFPQMQLVEATPNMSCGTKLSLDGVNMEFVQRYGPSADPEKKIDTVGFFIAKFLKTAHRTTNE